MTLPLLTLLAACGSTDPAPTTAPPSERRVDDARPLPGPTPALDTETRHRLSGTVETIRLQNINKAAGQFSYQVELGVRVNQVEPVPEPWTRMKPAPQRVQVRVDPGRSWTSFTPEEQAALAPDGPRPTLHPPAYGKWTAGDSTELVVRFSSTDLAHLVE